MRMNCYATKKLVYKYMNNKTITLLIVLLSIVGSLCAQQNVLAAGGDATGTGGTVNYSVGQIVYTTAVGGQISVSQGVQQPYEFSTLGIDTYVSITLSMLVFPNPFTDFITLRLEISRPEALKYQLSDFSGKPLRLERIVNDETEIMMKGLPSATYILTISDGNSVLKTFKIIKN